MSKETTSLQVLSLIPGLIPGIEQVVLVHSQHDSAQFSAFLLKKEEGNYKTDPIRLEGGSAIFSSFNKSTQPYYWFPNNQVPFDIIAKDKIQLTIFSELKNSVLMISYYNSDVFLSDLFYIYFNENLSNFLLDKVSEPFSAQHKNMVGFLLSNAIRTLFDITTSQNHIASTFNDQIRLVVRERDQLREALESLAQKGREGILGLAHYYLFQITGSHGMKASFTDSAKIKLKAYSGELSQLESVIREALEFVGALNSSAPSGQLLIADYHIRFPEPGHSKMPEKAIEGLSPRLVKTHLLLDRLEIAASGIKQRKDNLTSANVGKEFPTPISAPAITDALRKHERRIVQLFDQYPEKWEIIRHEFRPIQNLLNSAHDHELLSA